MSLLLLFRGAAAPPPVTDSPWRFNASGTWQPQRTASAIIRTFTASATWRQA